MNLRREGVCSGLVNHTLSFRGLTPRHQDTHMAPRKKSNRTTASKVPTSRKHAVQKSTPRKKPSGAKNTAASTRATRSTRTPAVLATTRTTRYQAVNAARNAVLNTTELLEHILIHLPADSILAAQRVSKTFKNVIQGSILIAQQIDFARDSPRNRPGKVESWQPDSATHPNSTTFEPWDNSSFTTAARLTVRDLNTCVFKSSPDPERRTNHYNFLSRTVPNGETFYFKSKNMSPAILRSMRLQPQSWDDFWITARHPTWRQPLVINMAIRIGVSVKIQVFDHNCVFRDVRWMLFYLFDGHRGAEAELG